MKLIAFSQPGSERLVFINPEHVISITSIADDRTQIMTVGQAGTNFAPIVQLDVMEVRERLQGDE